MPINPLSPLVERTEDIKNIGANMITAAQEVGASVVGTTVEYSKGVVNNVEGKSKETLGLATNVGSRALEASVDVSKAGLRVPGATLAKIGELGTGLVSYASGLLKAPGDRPESE